MFKKMLLVASGVVVFGDINGTNIVKNFKEADSFSAQIMAESDTTKAQKNITLSIDSIADDNSMDSELRIGIIEKIKSDLSNDFPFITKYAEHTVSSIYAKSIGSSDINKNGLYEAGREAELGLALLHSQEGRIQCLDIILKAARLLKRYDENSFDKEIKPFMKKNRLNSFL